MIKSTNTSIKLTFSKEQARWLRTNAKKLNMSVSKFVKFLIDKNISKFANQLRKEELDNLIKIAKTPWLDFGEEE